jgi:hypothetical protein
VTFNGLADFRNARITVCPNYLNTNEAKHNTQKYSNIMPLTELLLLQVILELFYSLVFNSW